MPIAMATIDSEGKFLWVNNYLCDVLERTEGELLSASCFGLVYEGDAKVDSEFRKDLIEGKIPSYSIVKAYKKKGDTPTHRRLVYGSFTAWRNPPEGEFENLIVFFVPHNNIGQAPRPSFNGMVAWIRENWKWILAMVSTSSALTTGNYAATWDALRQAQEMELQVRQLQSELDSHSQSRLPAPSPEAGTQENESSEQSQ